MDGLRRGGSSGRVHGWLLRVLGDGGRMENSAASMCRPWAVVYSSFVSIPCPGAGLSGEGLCPPWSYRFHGCCAESDALRLICSLRERLEVSWLTIVRLTEGKQ